jgi:hypothetical protein
MKFSAVVLAQIVLAASALAAPKGHGLAARVARRAGGTRLSHPKIPATPTVDGKESDGETQVDYSSNWSGAVLTAPPSGSTFTSVSAQFTVPSPQPVGGQAGAASAWVGIDGDTYSNAILQTGIDFNVDASGGVSYDAWYEWFPDYAYDFSGIDINIGDVISVSVVSSSSSSGTATIENLSNGQTVTQDLTAPDSSSTLGGQNAEWIVEDFEEGGSLVSFANFGTVDFTSAAAGTSSGATVGTTGSDLIDIQSSSGQVLTSASTPSDSEVVVQYTG